MNPDRTSTPDDVAANFIETMGLSAEADGLPRIAGRMWGFLILHEGIFSFAELAEKLQVSRGSISTNARLLRDLGIIERVARPGDRQDYYRITDNPCDRLVVGYIERMKRLHKNIQQTLNSLPEDWTAARSQLSDMQDFYEQAVQSSEALVESMRLRREKEAEKMA